MLWLAKFFVKEGKTPTQWLDGHLSARRYQDSDRSVHELRSLARILETGGSYDQLNLAALGSFELIARRWQLILEAHRENAAVPSYEASDYFSGLERGVGIAPALSAHVAKVMKEEAEVEKQRSKVRELRGPPRGRGGRGGGGAAAGAPSAG